MQADTLHHWSSTQLFSFIQQATHKAESLHEDLSKEHKHQMKKLHMVTEE